MSGLLNALWAFLSGVLGFLFFSWWGWLILFLFVFPVVGGWLRRVSRRRHFYRARRAELANPRDAQVRFLLGRLHFEARHWRRALPFLRDALAISLKHDLEVDPMLPLFLGHSLRHLGHREEAIVAYELSLKDSLEHLRGEAECGLGASLISLGRVAEGEKQLRLATQLNQSAIESRLRLIRLLDQSGRSQEARSLLQETRAIELPAFLRKQQRGWRLLLAFYPLSRPFL